MNYADCYHHAPVLFLFARRLAAGKRAVAHPAEAEAAVCWDYLYEKHGDRLLEPLPRQGEALTDALWAAAPALEPLLPLQDLVLQEEALRIYRALRQPLDRIRNDPYWYFYGYPSGACDAWWDAFQAIRTGGRTYRPSWAVTEMADLPWEGARTQERRRVLPWLLQDLYTSEWPVQGGTLLPYLTRLILLEKRVNGTGDHRSESHAKDRAHLVFTHRSHLLLWTARWYPT